MKVQHSFEEDIECIVEPVNNKGGIYVSNIEAAENPLTLQKYRIGAVITAIRGKNLSEIIPKHIEYLYVPAVDHQSFDISVYFQDTYAFIDEERIRTNVLVHCMAGISRSVSLVIAYLMRKEKLSMNEAYNLVKSKRNKIFPNQSFIKQLKQLQLKLKPTNGYLKQKQFNKSAVSGNLQIKTKSISAAKKYVYSKNHLQIAPMTTQNYELRLKSSIRSIFHKKIKYQVKTPSSSFVQLR